MPLNDRRSVHISIIIPTYNRKESLLRTLDSLAQQTFPGDKLEVIVVDDGGTDESGKVVDKGFPFALTCLRQENQGDAAARNLGAEYARGELLVFLDDDILVVPEFISGMAREYLGSDRLIVVGKLLPMPSDSLTPFERARNSTVGNDLLDHEIDFTQVLSGILSVKKDHYLALGMMRPVYQGGSSVWCDVDFAYRAHLQGFRFLRSQVAVGYHNDYASRDLAVACRRAERAAFAGVNLFLTHPGLKSHLPMFKDKGPIEWRNDALILILRKLARQLLSSQPVMAAMEYAVFLLEHHTPTATALRLLYRWIISGYIYRGYHEGLQVKSLVGTDR